MLEKIIYNTSATVKGGRMGHVKSADGAVDLQLVLPKEMGGPGGGANPETLFAAGYAACFEGATRLVAGQEKVAVGPDTWVRADVGIGPRKEGGYQLAVTLSVHLDGVDLKTAQKIAEKAHLEVCPYSHATRGNIDVTVKAV